MDAKKKNTLIGALAVFVCLCLVCLGAGWVLSGDSEPQTAEDYMKKYGGNPEIYQRILTSTNCDALQAEFDQAESNLELQQPGTSQYQWGLGYMDAVNRRMEEIGCYNAEGSRSLPIDMIIANTAQAAQTQTSLVVPTFTEIIFTLPAIITQPTLAPTWTSMPYPTIFIITVQPVQTGLPATGCNPYYPDVCIHDNPRLNCTVLKAKGISKFRVLPPDPLGYDRDGDGIGCEN